MVGVILEVHIKGMRRHIIMPKILIIDGNSLAHRAYHAVPPTLTRSDKVPTNAVFGFCNMIIKLLEQEKPDMAVCAFDRAAPTFRKLAYEEYKAHRKPLDEELRIQLPILREAASAFGIDVEEMDGYEADDIIGTLSKGAAKKSIDVTIITGDKDALQLVDNRIQVVLTKKGISEFEKYDVAKVYEKYGFEPVKIIDLKAFMGDASDNIPGVKGIGEKTALQLVKDYGSVENVFENLENISSSRVRMLLEEGKQSAYDSKMLATICLEVPIDFEESKFALKKDENKLARFLSEQEFKSLIGRLRLTYVKPEPRAAVGFATLFDTVGTPEPDKVIGDIKGRLVLSEEELEGVVKDISTSKEMVLEIISDDKNYMLAKVFGIGILWRDKFCYIPIKEEDVQESLISFEEGPEILPKGIVYSKLKPILENDSIKKKCHDSKKIKVLMNRRKIDVKGIEFDSMLAAYLVNPAVHNADISEVLSNWLGIGVSDYKETISLASDSSKYDELADIVKNRLQHFIQLESTLLASIKQLGMEKLYYEVELKLSCVLSDMEIEGVKIDSGNLLSISQTMQGKVSEYIKKIYELAGFEFNINSPKQLSSVLFETLGMKPLKKTKSGYSTDSEVLEALTEEHEIVQYILSYRKVSKLKSTYVDALPQLVNPETGRIHTTYNQALTLTGRLSSINPNLQNIPVRTDDGKEIRGAFVSRDENWVIMSADYSQIELRVLAHISQDPKLIESFLADEDVHTRTAAEVYNVAFEDVTPSMRASAKSVNFGIVYGISDFGLARNLGISMSEAKEFITKYFETYKGVKNYMESIVSQAKIDGYVTTLMNRRRQLPELFGAQKKFGERVAMNTPIQGTAADIIKCAMNNVSEKLGEYESKMIMQVHDELVLDVPQKEIVEIIDILRYNMESAMELKVPLKVDIGYGKTWLLAK